MATMAAVLRADPGGSRQSCAFLREYRQRRAEAGTARGRVFKLKASLSKSRCEQSDRSKPFGRCCRTRPFMFSLERRCHGECVTQKYTPSFNALASSLCRAHLLALVVGEALAHGLGHFAKLAREANHRDMGRAILHHDEGRQAALALDQRADRAAAGAPS